MASYVTRQTTIAAVVGGLSAVLVFALSSVMSDAEDCVTMGLPGTVFSSISPGMFELVVKNLHVGGEGCSHIYWLGGVFGLFVGSYVWWYTRSVLQSMVWIASSALSYFVAYWIVFLVMVAVLAQYINGSSIYVLIGLSSYVGASVVGACVLMLPGHFARTAYAVRISWGMIAGVLVLPTILLMLTKLDEYTSLPSTWFVLSLMVLWQAFMLVYIERGLRNARTERSRQVS